ncbi:MAG: electron transport complex subunit E [Eubacterium sp.]|jgi:electron transport complex protein RnfE|uniref:Ion-translocating oxidoreductase complex subunit E n=1 Tax=Eubacterium cellulosolvens (strain ATCC 43171 / JCM 9499 / 6) TaxID=633697 RepID=I5AVS2_EUBC6|nr:electron transport complex subunit E [Eubacterium sp.]
MSLKKDTPIERLWNGLFVENPVFVLVLGTCPTLATSTSATNAIGMGLSTTAVLMMSNLIISLLRKIIPDRMRMPAYIVVIASFVTMVDFLMEGFTPGLYKTLGIYIPLIVVNCIIMGRAEAYAGKKPVISSFFDGVGMGIGFTVALTLIASFRELFGAGTIFGAQIMPSGYVPISTFVLAPGAFLVYGFLIAAMNALKIGAGRRPKKEWDPTEKICGECFKCMKVGMCGQKPENCGETAAQTIAKNKGTVDEAIASGKKGGDQ